MKIPNHKIQFDRANKTASLADKSEARAMLQKIAADLVSNKGAVRSGYLRLSASGNDVDVKAGFMGSGATAATSLIREMVKDAYGKHALGALDAYLSKRTSGIGTVSFVKLVQAMEAQEAKHEPKSEVLGKIKSANAAGGRLGSGSLIPIVPKDASWNTKFELAEKTGQAESVRNEARVFALSASNFIKKITKADLELFNKDAGALYRAIYHDPSILDPSRSDDERAELLKPHTEAHIADLVSARLENFGVSDPSELSEDDRSIFDGIVTALETDQETLQQPADLKSLANPQVREAFQRVLVGGKEAGLSLDALLVLPRGNNHKLVSGMDFTGASILADKLVNRDPLTANELALATTLFGKLDVSLKVD